MVMLIYLTLLNEAHDDDDAVGDDDVDDVDLPHPPQRGPGMAGGATGATVPPTAALAAAFCFSIVQSNV